MSPQPKSFNILLGGAERPATSEMAGATPSLLAMKWQSCDSPSTVPQGWDGQGAVLFERRIHMLEQWRRRLGDIPILVVADDLGCRLQILDAQHSFATWTISPAVPLQQLAECIFQVISKWPVAPPVSSHGVGGAADDFPDAWVHDALRESERRFREIVFSMAGWIWETGPDWCITYSSENVKDYLGYTADEVIGRLFYDFFTSRDRETLIPVFQELAQSGAPIRDREIWMEHGVGQPVCLQISGEIRQNSEGSWRGYRGVAKDITQQKKIELALKESEEKYRNWFNHTEVGMIRLRVPGLQVEAVNAKFVQLFDIDSAALWEGASALPLAEMGLSNESLDGLLSDGRWIDREVKLNRQPGGMRHLLTTAHYFSDVGYIEASAVDISSQKAAEDSLRQSNERLQELDQLKSEFLSTVSHELRTPIAIMGEGVSLCLDEIAGPLNSDQRDLLEDTHQNIERLSRLISDLLDVSRIEAGRVLLRKHQFNLAVTARQSLDGFQHSAREKKIALIYEGPELLKLYADSDKVRQIFDNLVSNALRFTPEHGQVTLQLENGDDAVTCRVSDTGIGIAQKDQATLFSKFAQIGRVDGPGYKGTGLGLAIVKGLVEKHGGRVTVHSCTGEGATFAFTLQRIPAPEIALFDGDVERGASRAAVLKEAGYACSIVNAIDRVPQFSVPLIAVGYDDSLNAGLFHEEKEPQSHPRILLYGTGGLPLERLETLDKRPDLSLLQSDSDDLFLSRIRDLLME